MTAEGLANQFKKRHDRACSQPAVAIAFQTKRLSSGKGVTNILSILIIWEHLLKGIPQNKRFYDVIGLDGFFRYGKIAPKSNTDT